MHVHAHTPKPNSIYLDQVPDARLEEQLLVRELLGGHGLGAGGEGRDQVHRERREAHAAEHLGCGGGSQ